MRRKAAACYKGGMRRILIALSLLLSPLLMAHSAAAQSIMAAIRADQWDTAAALAAGAADPVARRLVTYYHLLAPGEASAAQIARFVKTHPDWPAQALLERRREAAIATEPSDAAALAACMQRLPTAAAALARCATAFTLAGRTQLATAAARAAWVNGFADPVSAASFLQHWGQVLRERDEWRRFDRLAWNDESAAATRQVDRLSTSDQAVAQARLALVQQSPDAPALLAALPAGHRNDPMLMLDQAGYLERADDEGAAAALWRTGAAAAERDAPASRLPAFWHGREILVHDLMRDHRPRTAYALATQDLPDQKLTRDAIGDSFLAGFIALRFLHDPVAASVQFQRLADLSKAAITQGRAHYWLGRAAAAAGNAATARAEYARAEAWPTTFYGQLAALALGDSTAQLDARIRAVPVPSFTRSQALDFASREVARAAATLVSWGAPRRARVFLLRLGELAPDPADREMAAKLALGFGLPDSAVGIARVAGLHGEMLVQAGWPIPISPPADGPGRDAVLGLIRQESSFDTGAVSPSGALGLMQLMPGTARMTARQMGDPGLAAAAADENANMRLGSFYFGGLLTRFDNCLPLAIAAYNAGPRNVATWLAAYGDFRTGGIDAIDWLELIPFGETRDYVQRVIENIVVYRALERSRQPHPLAKWLH